MQVYLIRCSGYRKQSLALNSTLEVTVLFQPAKISPAIIMVKSEKVTIGCACSSIAREKNRRFKSSHLGNHEGGAVMT